MSLGEAVLAVADAMEDLAKDPSVTGEAEIWRAIKGFVRELRTAVKAATNTDLPPEMRALANTLRQAPPGKSPRPPAEPPDVGEMKVLRGGTNDGLTIPVSAHMPVGANLSVMGEVYTKDTQGQLHYNEALTIKNLRAKGPDEGG